MANCGSSAGEVADAKVTTRAETLSIIEAITLKLLEAVANGTDPSMHLTCRSEKNVVRDDRGHTHLGRVKTVKFLFGKKAVGSDRFAKIWQVLALIQRLVIEGKMVTQREGYYSLVQHFKHQSEFNDTLQDVVALTGCARASLGICGSTSGAIAGCVLWKEEGTDPYNCSTSTHGKSIPGECRKVSFESLGARYILVVEKDAVFTYLCGQRLWDSLPCVLVTGCGYPPLSVRAVLKQLSTELQLPVLGLFDYNPHGIQILLTYKIGSVRMGLESHAYALDLKWLGLHHQDIMEEDPGGSGGRLKVEASALQQWTASDHRVFNGVQSRMRGLAMAEPRYGRELALMEKSKVKAEIEAINGSDRHLDSLENKIIRKIICKMYF